MATHIRAMFGKKEKPEPPPSFKGRSDDFIIMVVGVSGVGKSTLINTLLSELDVPQMKVSGGLCGCTSDPVAVEIPVARLGVQRPAASARRLIVLDTPGFNDANTSDTERLLCISEWLKNAYKKHVKIWGVIYLHDVSQNARPCPSADILRELVGADALRRAVVGMARWDLVPAAQRPAAQARVEAFKADWQARWGAAPTVFHVEKDIRPGAEVLCQLEPQVQDEPWTRHVVKHGRISVKVPLTRRIINVSVLLKLSLEIL